MNDMHPILERHLLTLFWKFQYILLDVNVSSYIQLATPTSILT